MKTIPNTSGNMSGQQGNNQQQPHTNGQPGTGETIATTPPKNWWGIAAMGFIGLLVIGSIVLSVLLTVSIIRFLNKRAKA
ncbi:hypothetical protein [Flavihumibacter sp. CACIAM 22H1]|uniref:hypothetical protein n=1 Tax=Flavihumibacter sp. CACIAM 22H1 TaxID=1812911 RepID=UPI0007A816F7|nr:hypothetical protein [Flavihumibacter sp. CACIAM 22H1]KYP13040.1 MAG: hypothetical protein A1D16_04870 [Flavihumibacter sp. CACIAM 22H1]